MPHLRPRRRRPQTQRPPLPRQTLQMPRVPPQGSLTLTEQRKETALHVLAGGNKNVKASTLPRADQLDASKVGTAAGEAERRRHLDSARSLACAPRLLLQQDQSGPPPRRP